MSRHNKAAIIDDNSVTRQVKKRPVLL